MESMKRNTYKQLPIDENYEILHGSESTQLMYCLTDVSFPLNFLQTLPVVGI